MRLASDGGLLPGALGLQPSQLGRASTLLDEQGLAPYGGAYTTPTGWGVAANTSASVPDGRADGSRVPVWTLALGCGVAALICAALGLVAGRRAEVQQLLHARVRVESNRGVDGRKRSNCD